jgi:hypothetical protein
LPVRSTSYERNKDAAFIDRKKDAAFIDRKKDAAFIDRCQAADLDCRHLRGEPSRDRRIPILVIVYLRGSDAIRYTYTHHSHTTRPQCTIINTRTVRTWIQLVYRRYLQFYLRRRTSSDVLSATTRYQKTLPTSSLYDIPSAQHLAVSDYSFSSPPLRDHYTWWRSGSLLQTTICEAKSNPTINQIHV